MAAGRVVVRRPLQRVVRCHMPAGTCHVRAGVDAGFGRVSATYQLLWITAPIHGLFRECSLCLRTAPTHVHPVIHRELGLNSNNLQGALPSVIGCLPALSRLRLNNNPGLTGPLPAAIGELAHLVYVGGHCSCALPPVHVAFCTIRYAGVGMETVGGGEAQDTQSYWGHHPVATVAYYQPPPPRAVELHRHAALVTSPRTTPESLM